MSWSNYLYAYFYFILDLLLTVVVQQTVHVNRDTLLTLTQESLEKTSGIQRLEEAAAELYKALLAGQDNGNTINIMPSSLITNVGIPRHGCNHGTTGRVSNTQFTILQTHARLPNYYVYRTGKWLQMLFLIMSLNMVLV